MDIDHTPDLSELATWETCLLHFDVDPRNYGVIRWVTPDGIRSVVLHVDDNSPVLRSLDGAYVTRKRFVDGTVNVPEWVDPEGE